jgi:hypothetical protein
MSSNIPSRFGTSTRVRNALLEFYMDDYTHTLRRIDGLYEDLSNIRQIINTLSDYSNLPNMTIPSQYRTRERNSMRNHERGSGIGRAGQGDTALSSSGASSLIYIDGTPYRIEFASYTTELETEPDSRSRDLSDCIRTVNFSDIETPLNTTCPISFEQFHPTSVVSQILGCQHIFMEPSLRTWFNTSVRCPMCRYDVRLHRTRGPVSTLNTSTSTSSFTSPVLSTRSSLGGLAEALISQLLSQDNFGVDASMNATRSAQE